VEEEQNKNDSIAPEPPLGIFRLLNDSERQMLQLQRQLTDDAVRCVGRERESMTHFGFYGQYGW
jgi:hypothetical protein